MYHSRSSCSELFFKQKSAVMEPNMTAGLSETISEQLTFLWLAVALACAAVSLGCSLQFFLLLDAPILL